ncbi:MAG TPA: hypothetical protein VFK02_27920 [Kofleriaceae bacterium]|nr:hypothetical protein [Kofleriaceae bacterium]
MMAGAVAPDRRLVELALPVLGGLRPGEHDVGFRRSWDLDYARTYQMQFADGSKYAADKAPRPVLINVWYPASASQAARRMRHREYLDVTTAQPDLRRFSHELTRYHRDIAIRQVLGAPEPPLGAEEQRLRDVLLDVLLDMSSAAIPDAPVAAGRFPVVIYHPGHGSSFEDNAILCEYLAGHGYVVIGSAYQVADGSSFNIDGRDGSLEDMQFLAAWARRLPWADWTRIAVVGHSGGAQAAILLRARRGSVVNAVVCLDTTQDYYSTLDSRWEHLTTTALGHREQLSVPMLVAANRHAIFQLLDELHRADRFYVTAGAELDHDRFISQGVLHGSFAHARAVATLRSPGQPIAATTPAPSAAHVTAMWCEYRALCERVRAFLDRVLKRGCDVAGGPDRARHDPCPDELGVEHVARGVTRPASYAVDSPAPPEPRQVRYLLRERGVGWTRRVLSRFCARAPASPIYHKVFAFSLLYELVEREQTGDALALYELYREVHPGLIHVFLDVGAQFGADGYGAFASSCARVAAVLDPWRPGRPGGEADRCSEGTP